MRFVDPSVDNIHLRIANDIYVFIQKTYEIGSGLVGVLVMLMSFAIILAGLSAITPLPLFGDDSVVSRLSDRRSRSATPASAR